METVLFAPNIARPSVHAAFCPGCATAKPVAVAFIVQEMPAMPQDQAPDCTRQPELAARSAASAGIQLSGAAEPGQTQVVTFNKSIN